MMPRRLSLLLFCLLSAVWIPAFAGVTAKDADSTETRLPWARRVLDRAYEIVKAFNDIDTNYITPQRYNYTLMLQGTHTFERYTLTSKTGQSVAFAPRPSLKVGPYIGWRWVFLGYQIDFSRLHSDTRKEFDLSLYSSHVGIDIFSRNASSGYRIDQASSNRVSYDNQVKDTPFDGIEVGIRGFNVYYILNHKRFSYPAAFSQSTMQRRSAGSWMLGMGYTHHNIKLNHERLQTAIAQLTNDEMQLDSSFNFNQINYRDLSASVGYAYNLAFARNWLFAVSLSMSLGYKHAHADVDDIKQNMPFVGFSFDNMNFDGVGRFGLVWNNMRWFVGTSAILHGYNYNKSQFSMNNTFGNFNIYAGYNFGARHRRHHKR